MQIINMSQLNSVQIVQVAQILTDSIPIGWPTLQDALDEIKKRLIPENTLLAAVEDEVVLGWGGILAPTMTAMSSSSTRSPYVPTCAGRESAGQSSPRLRMKPADRAA